MEIALSDGTGGKALPSDFRPPATAYCCLPTADCLLPTALLLGTSHRGANFSGSLITECGILPTSS